MDLASFPVSTPYFFPHVFTTCEKKLALGVETWNEAKWTMQYAGLHWPSDVSRRIQEIYMEWPYLAANWYMEGPGCSSKKKQE